MEICTVGACISVNFIVAYRLLATSSRLSRTLLPNIVRCDFQRLGSACILYIRSYRHSLSVYETRLPSCRYSCKQIEVSFLSSSPPSLLISQNTLQEPALCFFPRHKDFMTYCCILYTSSLHRFRPQTDRSSTVSLSSLGSVSVIIGLETLRLFSTDDDSRHLSFTTGLVGTAISCS